jgi:hypothetical protein
MGELSLDEYLKNPSTFDDVKLVSSGVISFHWSNWDKLLQKINKRIEKGDYIKNLDELSFCLEEYRNVPVWFKNIQGSVKSNLYDLYSYFLDPRLKELWFELNEETLVSFNCASGPFVRLQSMRWFDQDVYRQFIYGKLLRNLGLSKRGFRINVDIPLEFEFKGTVQENIPASITQISKDGILIKVSGRADFQILERMDQVGIKANLNSFKKVTSKKKVDLNEIFGPRAFNFSTSKGKFTTFGIRTNILDLGSNRSNSFYSNGTEYFLFLRFEDLYEIGESKKTTLASMRKTVQILEEQASDLL